MYITADKLAEKIEKLAPLDGAYSWDNSGYNIKLHDDIQKILICVDISSDVIEEALELGADTIISHHPMIFKPIKTIDTSSPVGKLVHLAIKNNLNVYCAHTSFDCAEGGMNDVIAQKFGIDEFEILAYEDGTSIGTIGTMKFSANIYEFAEIVNCIFGTVNSKFSNYTGEIRKVAFVGGAGGSFIGEAKRKGADALVTGEAKHNEYLEANELGILLVTAGHYSTEKCFCDTVLNGLQTIFNELEYNTELYVSDKETAPYKML